jgi:hypothetical protein
LTNLSSGWYCPLLEICLPLSGCVPGSPFFAEGSPVGRKIKFSRNLNCFLQNISATVFPPGGSPPLRALCGRKLRLLISTAGCPAPAKKITPPRSTPADRGGFFLTYLAFLRREGSRKPVAGGHSLSIKADQNFSGFGRKKSLACRHPKGFVEEKPGENNPEGKGGANQADTGKGKGHAPTPGTPGLPGKDGPQQRSRTQQEQEQHGQDLQREPYHGGPGRDNPPNFRIVNSPISIRPGDGEQPPAGLLPPPAGLPLEIDLHGFMVGGDNLEPVLADIILAAAVSALPGLAPGPEHGNNLDGPPAPPELPGQAGAAVGHQGGVGGCDDRLEGFINESFGHAGCAFGQGDFAGPCRDGGREPWLRPPQISNLNPGRSRVKMIRIRQHNFLILYRFSYLRPWRQALENAFKGPNAEVGPDINAIYLIRLYLRLIGYKLSRNDPQGSYVAQLFPSCPPLDPRSGRFSISRRSFH